MLRVREEPPAVAARLEVLTQSLPRVPEGFLEELAREYKGRTCFVTGADGFIGSHMVEQLVEYGADVRAFVRATSSGELRNIGRLKDKIRVRRGNLTDKTSVDAAVRDLADGAGTIIFHLAAQA